MASLERFYPNPSDQYAQRIIDHEGRLSTVERLLQDPTRNDARYVNSSGDSMSGALVLPDGSDATPSLSFTGDLNTGFRRISADNLSVVTGGVQRLNVDSSGDTTLSGRLILPDGTLASTGLQFTGDSDTGIRRTGANGLSLVTAGTDRLTVDGAGQIGIANNVTVPIVRSDVAVVAKKTDDTTVASMYALSIRETILGANQAFTNVAGGSEVTMLTDTFTTIRTNALVTVTLMVEYLITGVDAAGIAICVCKVDGTAQSHNLNNTYTTLQGRDPRQHTWTFTLATAASHTVLIAIRKNAAGGTVNAGSGNTLMQIRIEQ